MLTLCFLLFCAGREIVVEHNPDEVSTLGDPTGMTPTGMMMGMMNAMEREEERTAR